MNACPPGTAFQQYLAAGNVMATTTYIDALGRFAKRWADLAFVVVTFQDGVVYELTKAEYQALPRETRELMQRTQSGPVPNPDASNA